ncbi:uncharacterized protein LOC132622911 [Lycium barbarum]|uniref:uncharacterized protein LOC132622911 n=1 Tax=Lycium barbarum TaxID=112863 RepID=UPI00293E9963|nr:uncharacterized protein LOC132622911 [Lycium barbarum]
MENRRRFFKNQMQTNKSKAKSSTIICKKHPKHKQNPGVCSICLSEKLSLLSRTSRSNTTTITSSCSSSSLSSLSSSSDVSSCSSPPRYRTSTNVLMKSRSLALIMRRRDGGIILDENNNGKKKKGGFLSRLLNPMRNRKDEGLAHSRTMRERVITRLRTTAA